MNEYLNNRFSSNLDNHIFDKFSQRRKMEIVKFMDSNDLIGQTPENVCVFLIGSLLDMSVRLGESFAFHSERNSSLIDEIVDLRKLIKAYVSKIEEIENESKS